MKSALEHSYIFIIFSCILAACAQTILKMGSHAASSWQDILNIKIFIGLLLYCAGTVIWIFALSKIDLHIAYAYTSITLILVMLSSSFFLGEKLSASFYAGACLIVFGVIIISFSGSK